MVCAVCFTMCLWHARIVTAECVQICNISYSVAFVLPHIYFHLRRYFMGKLRRTQSVAHLNTVLIINALLSRHSFFG